MSVLAVVGSCRERETERDREKEKTNGSLLYFVQHDISHTCLCWLLWACAERERETERKRKQMEVCYTLCSMTSLRHVCVSCCVFGHRERERANGSSLYFVQHDISETCLCQLLCVWAERERE